MTLSLNDSNGRLMLVFFDMSLVEQTYQKHLKQLSGMERIERVRSLYKSMHESLYHQISSADQDLSEIEIRTKIARRMYSSDSKAQDLIGRALS